jgi:hypothetical protein
MGGTAPHFLFKVQMRAAVIIIEIIKGIIRISGVYRYKVKKVKPGIAKLFGDQIP